MSTVSGYIEQVVERPSKYKWPNGQQKASMWSMRVDNVNYGCKNTKPPAEGTYVQFEASQNDAGYWDADGTSIKPSDMAPAPTPAAVPQQAAASFVPQAAPAGRSPGAIAADTRQDSIIYQSSRKDALELIKALLNKDMLDFGKAKVAQKIEIVEVYLDQYTVRFFEDAKRLAPPEHDNPINATSPDEVTELARPPRKARVELPPILDEGDFEDQVPF